MKLVKIFFTILLIFSIHGFSDGQSSLQHWMENGLFESSQQAAACYALDLTARGDINNPVWDSILLVEPGAQCLFEGDGIMDLTSELWAESIGIEIYPFQWLYQKKHWNNLLTKIDLTLDQITLNNGDRTVFMRLSELQRVLLEYDKLLQEGKLSLLNLSTLTSLDLTSDEKRVRLLTASVDQLLRVDSPGMVRAFLQTIEGAKLFNYECLKQFTVKLSGLDTENDTTPVQELIDQYWKCASYR